MLRITQQISEPFKEKEMQMFTLALEKAKAYH